MAWPSAFNNWHGSHTPLSLTTASIYYRTCICMLSFSIAMGPLAYMPDVSVDRSISMYPASRCSHMSQMDNGCIST
uniref:Uncharacterized protein n=1 Tax=Setaria italica TaxID=4555 RepID=K4ANU8_SETIT